MFYEVIPAKGVGAATATVFTYASEWELVPGQVVLVPFRNAMIPGVVSRKVGKPEFKTKAVAKVLYERPLPEHLLKAIFWLSEYYLSPLAAVASAVLPNGVEKKRKGSMPAEEKGEAERRDGGEILLNKAQKTALAEIKKVETATKLLFGVTGSGKTNIYLKLAEETLAAGKSVILLVPEIALTSQLVQVFTETFGKNITLLHSRQTDSERHRVWERILNADGPEIVVGPRSALFAPVKDLGLIIIDEAHESSYYQENTPKYSASRLASFMASSLGITCLLGTATPLVADYYLAGQHQSLIPLKTKAKDTKPAEVRVIDLKDRTLFPRNRYFSAPLLAAIKTNLGEHHQTLIFHNRRGSAPLTLCESCGWQALCPTCFLPLTLHADSFRLLCHACGHSENVPLDCPDCHQPGVVHKGFGTKLLEKELRKLFPEARIARFDADNAKAEALDQRYSEVKNGEFDIIIGTQTVAKGLDLPLLATVGVVQADAGLSLPDFASEEHTFELLTQVIGRVGRGHLDTAEVFIQTYQPEHPVITAAVATDYEAFSEYLLSARKRAHFPPFAYLARLALTYKTEATVLKHVKALQGELKKNPGLVVSTPAPAFHERGVRGYTWEIVVKAASRKTLVSALAALRTSAKFQLTLDPPSLL